FLHIIVHRNGLDVSGMRLNFECQYSIDSDNCCNGKRHKNPFRPIADIQCCVKHIAHNEERDGYEPMKIKARKCLRHEYRFKQFAQIILTCVTIFYTFRGSHKCSVTRRYVKSINKQGSQYCESPKEHFFNRVRPLCN